MFYWPFSSASQRLFEVVITSALSPLPLSYTMLRCNYDVPTLNLLAWVRRTSCRIILKNLCTRYYTSKTFVPLLRVTLSITSQCLYYVILTLLSLLSIVIISQLNFIFILFISPIIIYNTFLFHLLPYRCLCCCFLTAARPRYVIALLCISLQQAPNHQI